MTTFKQALAAIEPALTKSVKPYARIIGKPRKSVLPLWSSKACDGRPYLPKTQKWPMRGEEPLKPVMQIDLAEVPVLPDFPRAGLLSLFWSEDYQERKLFYFAKRITDESKLWSQFPDFSGDFLYPYMKPVALAFERREGCVCWGDYRFEKLLGKATVDALHDSEHYNKLFDHVWKKSGSGDTRLGGYACPEQQDPREQAKYASYDAQLLQIQNDNFVHNIFMKPADLRSANFAKAMFYEACD